MSNLAHDCAIVLMNAIGEFLKMRNDGIGREIHNASITTAYNVDFEKIETNHMVGVPVSGPVSPDNTLHLPQPSATADDTNSRCDNNLS